MTSHDMTAQDRKGEVTDSSVLHYTSHQITAQDRGRQDMTGDRQQCTYQDMTCDDRKEYMVFSRAEQEKRKLARMKDNIRMSNSKCIAILGKFL